MTQSASPLMLFYLYTIPPRSFPFFNNPSFLSLLQAHNSRLVFAALGLALWGLDRVDDRLQILDIH